MMTSSLLLVGLIGILCCMTTDGFIPTNTRSNSRVVLSASSFDEAQGLFKAGLLANQELDAAALASKKIRSVKDLGWTKPAKRAGNTRPRHWAWGGAGEKAVQDKPNYDETSPMCVEKWLGLEEFYSIVKDDGAIADTIFVALAGGGAFIERDVAESVIAKWRDGKSFDNDAFSKTVKDGQAKFISGWALFAFATGTALVGIVFPTNPLQLALVDLLSSAGVGYK